MTAPTRAHYPLGLIEKNQQLVTESLGALWNQNATKWSKHEVLAMAVTAKNITPLPSTGLSPIQVLTGRNDLLPWKSQLDAPHQLQVENSTMTWNQLVLKRQQEIQTMRTNMIVSIDQKLLKMDVANNLRAHAKETFVYGDRVQIWDSDARCWVGVFRFLFSTGRNGFAERGSPLKKFPIQRIRRHRDGEEEKLIEIPNAEYSQDSDTGEGKTSTADKKECQPRLHSDHEASSSSNSPPSVQQDGNPPKTNSPRSPIAPPPIPVSVFTKKYFLRSAAKNWMMDTLVSDDYGDHPQTVPEESPEDVRKWMNEEFGVFGLSRIPPKTFLVIPKARGAIREELFGLLEKGKFGIPIAALVKLNDPQWEHLTRAHTTMVMKIKPNGQFKSCVCLRGGQVSFAAHRFSSAPTVGGDFRKYSLAYLSIDPIFAGYNLMYQRRLPSPNTCIPMIDC